MPDSVSIPTIIEQISLSEADGLRTDRREAGLDGISGDKTVGLLQRLASIFSDDDTACYLEVGVFQGLTLISAALEAPSLPCFGIDNFATLDPDSKNLGIVEARISTFGVTNAQLINMDFEEALESLERYIGDRKVAVYFVDGPHDYRSQLICLTLIKPYLHEHAVIVIDDANYPDVRWSTRDFLLGHKDFRLAFDAYSPGHPANLSGDVKTLQEAGWLNGVNVLVRDPDHALADMVPPTNDHERCLFLNEWLVHRLRLAELAPEALMLADAVCDENSDEIVVAQEALREAFKKSDVTFDARFADRNMYSESFPSARLNKPY